MVSSQGLSLEVSAPIFPTVATPLTSGLDGKAIVGRLCNKSTKSSYRSAGQSSVGSPSATYKKIKNQYLFNSLNTLSGVTSKRLSGSGGY